MNAAVHQDERRLVPMTVASLNEVLPIEQAAYEFPWTRGNFIDSLHAGYAALLLRGAGNELLGYFLAMSGVDEMHLLNLTVAPAHQGSGHALYMLDALQALARSRHAAQLWLEVRVSNARARHLYERYGFRNVGLRKGYYPAAQGREDAIVMSLSL
ncbi:ribosomal protein S18-alanine N-acetyltransferase [Caldimonas thermodepolymerans]|uniref:[Ribosomal protein bS18]-alanine N-acetyltransferase n=1 Tax=Caldimonas thermodepolymerans TaxID=215580 RepID=A0AA46HW95_9BURK|nr:ribosomal protein S18-alanine N-acetyltransferase [Caldimonas thermodepolymerans]TCP08112.1 [SSU ribosomal protein S18P]-alanine acetyltransferase [Caldimonas thermodepolymerans]UZG48769.1 ribosomal protein S18-alanine N-acetyltransferase [Caldimonas thermodepolymerans]